jgi:hypothetical protein
MGVFGTGAVTTPALALYPWPPDGGASLTPDGGAPVALSGVDGASPDGWALDGGFGVFPHQPLEAGTWYTAHAAGSVSGRGTPGTPAQLPFDLTWRFQTAFEDPEGELAVDRRGVVTVSSQNPSTAHVTVSDANGSTVAARDLPGSPRERRRRSGVAAGSYRVCAHQDEARPWRAFDACRTMTVAARTQVTLAGRLAGRTLTVRPAVTPAGGQAVAVTVRHTRRRCGRFVNLFTGVGTVRACFPRWVVVARRTVPARDGAAIRIAVLRSDARIRVTVRVAAVSAGGLRHPARTVTRTFRRGR